MRVVSVSLGFVRGRLELNGVFVCRVGEGGMCVGFV